MNHTISGLIRLEKAFAIYATEAGAVRAFGV